MVEAEIDLADVAPVLRQMIAPPTPDDWRADEKLRVFFGLTNAEHRALVRHTDASADASIQEFAIEDDGA